jgi:hypothetical protein
LLTEIKLPLETKRIRSKGSFIFLQIKLPKWQIQNRLPTKAKENAIGIGKSNCQNGKLPIETKKNEDQEKHYLFANQIVQMTNPNCIANKGKGKCPSRQQKQTGSNGGSNKHVSLLECGCELSDSQPEKDRKKGACIFC